MQIKYYPLLILPVISAHAAPPLPQQQQQQQQSSPTATPQTLSAPLPVSQNPTPTPTPTPLAPPITGRPPSPPPTNLSQPQKQQPQQPPKLLLKSHDGGAEISSTPVVTCEEPTTAASPKDTDVQTLSKHYQSQQVSSLPPLELAKGKRACLPLESVPGTNAKIELCGQDVFVSYSDIGKVLDMLLASCTARGEEEDGSVGGGSGAEATKAASTAGMVSAIADGRVLFSVGVVGK